MTCDVLFVDDEPENRIVFEAACAGHFDVMTAASAKEALEILREHEVFVLIADQRMPEMTGLELLERVRDEFPNVVRMLVTAFADLQSAIDAINRGQVRRYLRKPWEHAELLSVLGEGVEYHHMRSKVWALERRLLETERVYALGVITAGLARELDGPVSALRGHVTRARDLLRVAFESVNATTPGGSPLRAHLVDADEELAEALARGQSVLDVVRGVGIPTGPAARQNVNASEVLRLTMKLIQSELRAAGSVVIDVRPVPLVSGSPAQVGHVMLNLLVGALDGMTNLPRERRELGIRLAHEEPWVVFEVKASGSPQAPEGGQRTPGSAPPDLGPGLGLAISHSIVSELGGELDSEHPPDASAVFRMRLRRGTTDT